MILALYVLVLLVAPVQHGLATLAAGADPRRLRTTAHATLNALAIVGAFVLLPVFVAQQQPLYLIVVPLGFRDRSAQSRLCGTPAAQPGRVGA